MTLAQHLIAPGLYYIIVAAVVGIWQFRHNRLHGRDDPHYAEAWFVGALWFPLMVWVFARRGGKAMRGHA